ncbi:unnamed protein product, partial [Mesorhabditis belari]|uniref:Uncharacterized protein n=1 Tax=Mesorhabditis belari TaxID=2138241 RepID=A0AAF3EHE3_9BILA
ISFHFGINGINQSIKSNNRGIVFASRFPFPHPRCKRMPLLSFVRRCFVVHNESSNIDHSSDCPEIIYFTITPYIAFLPLFLFQLTRIQIGKQKNLKLSTIIKLRLILFTTLIILHFVELLLKHFTGNDYLRGNVFFYHFTAILSLLLALASTIFSNLAQRRFNGFVILFAMASLLFESIFLLIMILSSQTPSLWSLSRSCLLILLNLCMVKKDRPTNDKEACPYDYVGFYSTLIFSWMNRLIEIGHSKSLSMDDIFFLSFPASSMYLREKWRKTWEREVKSK